jgi:hypothetical protein
MSEELPGRPTRNNSSPQIPERLQVYLLLVLGIGLIGAGTAALGFAAQSIAAVGIGAGAMIAAGFLSLLFGPEYYTRTRSERRHVATQGF